MRAKPILRLLVLREKHGPFLRYLPGPSCSSRARGCSARVVCGPEATRNPTRGNGRRTQSTTLARAIRLVSRPSSSMAAAAVSTAASLTLPRRADRARGSSLRRRHCCVRPLAAASSSSQPTATTSGRYPTPARLTAPSLFLVVISSLRCVR
jgi:hypothetical protein